MCTVQRTIDSIILYKYVVPPAHDTFEFDKDDENENNDMAIIHLYDPRNIPSEKRIRHYVYEKINKYNIAVNGNIY